MAKTLVADLLAPYEQYLTAAREQAAVDGWDTTVAGALILAEAQHVADVRNAQGEPLGGWKNHLPLEHNTPLGFFIKACRTDDWAFIRSQAFDKTLAYETRNLYCVLHNAGCVYAPRNHKGMTSDELISYADVELYCS